PYLHNGDVATLEGVLEIYNMGGHPWLTRDTLIKPLNLSKEEIVDLIAFLKSLTDTEFLNNPKFMKPEMPESLK
ncbi:MAG: cytochrome c peroxidase, partial [Bacteroidota bacterium]|nr:cytochrome c peroxidase [Bacteroidota bacterium]